MKSGYTVSRPFYTILITTLLQITFCMAYAAAENSQAETNPESVVESDITESISPWHYNQQQLAENHPANEAIWLDVEGQQALALKYQRQDVEAKGNIILITAEGENPAHHRLAFPLSSQLSQLGWTVITVTPPATDYAKEMPQTNAVNEVKSEQSSEDKVPEAEQTAENATEEESVSYYFESQEMYQTFFSALINQTVEQAGEGKLIIIGNQTSSWWLLNNPVDTRVSHLVLIAPHLPFDQASTKQKIVLPQIPVYLILDNFHNSSTFVSAYHQSDNSQQISRLSDPGMMGNNIDLDDNQIARRIAGWALK
ncbi:MAG: alpha/beta hydrolase family protein [Gammaproteobacteria bacterium]|nr:alpha/beta hydrolase family protein [Gammaproteobacteria bacterium]